MARKLCIANLIVLQNVNCPHRTNAFIICLLSHQFSYDTWNKSSVDIKYANIYLPLCYYYISTCRKNNNKTTNVFSSYCNNKITMKSLDHTAQLHYEIYKRCTRIYILHNHDSSCLRQSLLPICFFFFVRSSRTYFVLAKSPTSASATCAIAALFLQLYSYANE